MKKQFILAVILLTITQVLLAQKAKIDTAKHATFYTCTMHPEVKEMKPGQCPKCGMNLTLSTKEQMKKAVTKTYTCPVHLDVTSKIHGKCPKCGRKLNFSPKELMKTQVMKIYTCPMHPEVALDKDGVCPKCGAALVEKSKN